MIEVRLDEAEDNRRLLLALLNRKVVLVNELWALWQESRQVDPAGEGDESLRVALGTIERTLLPSALPAGYVPQAGDQSHLYHPYFHYVPPPDFGALAEDRGDA